MLEVEKKERMKRVLVRVWKSEDEKVRKRERGEVGSGVSGYIEGMEWEGRMVGWLKRL